jgi:hypothetical protein
MRGRAHPSPEEREGTCAGDAITGQCCQSGPVIARTFSFILVRGLVLLVPGRVLLVAGRVLLLWARI